MTPGRLTDSQDSNFLGTVNFQLEAVEPGSRARVRIELGGDGLANPQVFKPDLDGTAKGVIVDPAVIASLPDAEPPAPGDGFQVTHVRQLASGIALGLSEAPDLEVFNLYDGTDASIDAPDLVLRDGSGQAVALSAHWQASSQELVLLAAAPLAPGTYSLTVDARVDGLISAETGEPLTHNGDQATGEPYGTSFLSSADVTLAMADTARGPGQALSLNGTDHQVGLSGLPITLWSSRPIMSLSGAILFNQSVFLEGRLREGTDLPADWSYTTKALQPDPSADASVARISDTASGETPLSGNNLELFRFDAVVSAGSETAHGATELIELTGTAIDSVTGQGVNVAADPGLVALAYSGDITGNGRLSSLDASRLQRVVVELETGFDATTSSTRC